MREKTVYALGVFDGVHLGHQALLKTCTDMARELGVQAGVITFGTHPDKLLKGAAAALINTVQQRQALLQTEYGMEQVLVLPFDEKLMATSWEDFYHQLKAQYNAAGLVCGADFRFGYKGLGTAQLLKERCEKDGLAMAIVPEQVCNGVRISSTHIRTLIEKGQMEEAVAFLGHPHIFTGQVVSGRKLGRTIGIPTANLLLPEGVVTPKFGVYACQAEVEGRSFLAVTNVGTRPTVGGHRVTVEPWILDFDGDLYGKTITLQFYKFLRPEQKFDSLDALRREIHKNAEETRKFFEKM